MSELNLEIAEVFEPLLAPARYKGAYGGRGSGKTRFFTDRLIEDSLYFPSLRSMCIREVQKDLLQSSKFSIEKRLNELRLGQHQGFKVYEDAIVTPGDGLIIFKGMNNFTADSIRSLEGFTRAWVEEAHTLSQASIDTLTPTLRDAGSELWFSWNPRRKTDPVDAMFRARDLPPSAIVVKANWRDNPWFPPDLEIDRQFTLASKPEQYAHVWEGDYVTALSGAYVAKQLAQAKLEGRIGHVNADPLMTVRAYWDIGGTGAKADAVAIWIAQFVGREIRLLNYYEATGQPLAYHVQWMREHGYAKALCFLPHDGSQGDKVFPVSYESALTDAGFDVEVIPNMGAGAKMLRVESARRLLPQCWFDAKCQPGIDALGWYHERRDDARGLGLGPEHDWSSHGFDGFGMMCIAYEAPSARKSNVEYKPPNLGSNSWMR